MSSIRALFLLLLFAVGCHKPQGVVLGQNPVVPPIPIQSLQNMANLEQVTIKGVMIEKCPVAGCWLRVKDRTGTIKVDTKNAGFVVVDVPLKQEVTIAGKIVIEGDERMLEAGGLRY